MPTQHPGTFCTSFHFFKNFSPTSIFHYSMSVCFFSNGDTPDGKHLLDSTNLAILAAVSISVRCTATSLTFLEKYDFYTNKSILAKVSRNDERTAPSSIFSDEIDCNKFITISKATKKKSLISPILKTHNHCIAPNPNP